MNRNRVFWPLVLLGSALLTLLCFHRVLEYGFTDKDSLMHITEARVDGLADVPALLSKVLTGGRARRDANFYRPTVMMMYAGLRGAFGWNPLGYHAFDLGLHALNGWLLALFASACALRTGQRRPRRFGLLCGLIFLIHPLGVETVPAIARNGDLLMTALFLTSLLALDRSQPDPIGVSAIPPLGGGTRRGLLRALCAHAGRERTRHPPSRCGVPQPRLAAARPFFGATPASHRCVDRALPGNRHSVPGDPEPRIGRDSRRVRHSNTRFHS